MKEGLQDISRRNFLRILSSTVAAGGLVLAGCETNPPPKPASAASNEPTTGADKPAVRVTVVPTAEPTIAPAATLGPARVATVMPEPTVASSSRANPETSGVIDDEVKVDVEMKRGQSLDVTQTDIDQGLVIVQGDIDLFDLRGGNRFRTYDDNPDTGSLGVMLGPGKVRTIVGGADVSYGGGCNTVDRLNLFKSLMAEAGCENGCPKGIKIWLWDGRRGQHLEEQAAIKIIDKYLAAMNCNEPFAVPEPAQGIK